MPIYIPSYTLFGLFNTLWLPEGSVWANIAAYKGLVAYKTLSNCLSNQAVG